MYEPSPSPTASSSFVRRPAWCKNFMEAHPPTVLPCTGCLTSAIRSDRLEGCPAGQEVCFKNWMWESCLRRFGRYLVIMSTNQIVYIPAIPPSGQTVRVPNPQTRKKYRIGTPNTWSYGPPPQAKLPQPFLHKLALVQGRLPPSTRDGSSPRE